MPGWVGSTRRGRLPANWPQLRKEQLERDDHQCQYVHSGGRKCKAKATDVDHVEAMTDDHSRLQSLCGFHHRMKSGREGGEAASAKRNKIKKSFRRTEPHPGLVP